MGPFLIILTCVVYRRNTRPVIRRMFNFRPTIISSMNSLSLHGRKGFGELYNKIRKITVEYLDESAYKFGPIIVLSIFFNKMVWLAEEAQSSPKALKKFIKIWNMLPSYKAVFNSVKDKKKSGIKVRLLTFSMLRIPLRLVVILG